MMYLRGASFSWFFNLLPEWFFANGLLLIIYFFVDSYYHKKEKPEKVALDRTKIRPIKIQGNKYDDLNQRALYADTLAKALEAQQQLEKQRLDARAAEKKALLARAETERASYEREEARKDADRADRARSEMSVQLLASKAALKGMEGDSALPLSMLLAAESLRREPLIDNLAILSKGLLLLPKPLVAKLLTILSQAGLVKGSPGPGGGYSLAREPKDITLYDVAVLFERAEDKRTCPFGPDWCGHGEPCPLHESLLSLDEKMVTFLRTTRLNVFQGRDNRRSPAGKLRKQHKAK
jgi:Rrf2 family protein